MAPKDRFSALARSPAAVLLFFSALLFLPAAFIGGKGSDLLCQLLWVKLFSAQFWGGDLYPRWLMDMYAGNGSPVFFYYPPLTYFITAFFSPLSRLDALGFAPITASAFLAVFVSGLTFYAWMRRECGDEKAALMGSLLYITGPACVAYNFYFGLFLPTLWAYAWVPLLLWSARKVALGEAYAMAAYAASLCLVIATNLPMTLIWGPASIVYAMTYFRRAHLVRQMLRLGLAVGCGFGLSAVYLLPAVSYLHYAIVKRQWTEPSTDFHNFFIRFDFSSLGSIFTAGWVAVALLVAIYYKALPERPRQVVYFAVIAGVALFMLLPVSTPVWESVNVLRILQFPERLFSLTSFALAALAAFAFPRLRRLSYVLVPAYLSIIGLAAFWPREPFPNFDDMLKLNIEQHANYMTSYDMVLRYYKPENLADVKAHHDQVELVSGNATVGVKQWAPRHIVLYYRAFQPSVLRVRQFYFPGFEARQAGQWVQIGREKTTGQVLLAVPEGEGEIRLELTPLAPETNGKIISGATLILLLALLKIKRLQNNA